MSHTSVAAFLLVFQLMLAELDDGFTFGPLVIWTELALDADELALRAVWFSSRSRSASRSRSVLAERARSADRSRSASRSDSGFRSLSLSSPVTLSFVHLAPFFTPRPVAFAASLV